MSVAIAKFRPNQPPKEKLKAYPGQITLLNAKFGPSLSLAITT